MKTVKRALALLLALTMLLAMGAVTALAAGETGSITIDNAVAGQTYTIYEILRLESYNAAEGQEAYSYKATDKWAAFINSADIKDVYVKVNEQGYVTWIKDADVAEFAKLAQDYAAKNGIANEGSQEAASATVKFENLELGYYLVDSSLGSLCSLDTTNPNVTIKEKNAAPTTDKQVQENSTGSWGKTNDADIGGTVNFKTTINVIDGNPKDYVLHDTMSEGLTFQPDSVKVSVNGEEITSGYTLVTNSEDGCTFEIKFADGTLKPNDVVTVTYAAVLNDKAVIADAGNPNRTHLSYKDTNGATRETIPSETRTYTWKIDVFKYTMKGETETPLADAEFVLYKEVNGEKQYAQAADGKITGWTSDKNAATIFKTPANGTFTISGLDSGAYYLEETTAPAGYNILKDPIKIEITYSIDSNTNVGTATVKYGGSSTGTIKVENNTGAELPSTGGVGTTIFYVLGGLLVVCAGVLLITKRRMNKEA